MATSVADSSLQPQHETNVLRVLRGYTPEGISVKTQEQFKIVHCEGCGNTFVTGHSKQTLQKMLGSERECCSKAKERYELVGFLHNLIGPGTAAEMQKFQQRHGIADRTRVYELEMDSGTDRRFILVVHKCELKENGKIVLKEISDSAQQLAIEDARLQFGKGQIGDQQLQVMDDMYMLEPSAKWGKHQQALCDAIAKTAEYNTTARNGAVRLGLLGCQKRQMCDKILHTKEGHTKSEYMSCGSEKELIKDKRTTGALKITKPYSQHKSYATVKAVGTCKGKSRLVHEVTTSHTAATPQR